jgi:hypothetical protein
MIIDERTFKESLQTAIKGVVGIVALLILKSIISSFLQTGVEFAGMALDAWIEVAIALVVVGFVFKLYAPVKTIVIFYLAALVKVGKVPKRDQYLGNLIAVAENVTLLVFMLIIYRCLMPVVFECNSAFLHFRALTTILNVVILLASVGILLVLWKNARPVVDLLTGHITDTVSTLSSGFAYVNCPACSTKNDRDALFCVSCGGKMGQPAAAAPDVASCCPQCATANAAAAKFCYKCGAALQ